MSAITLDQAGCSFLRCRFSLGRNIGTPFRFVRSASTMHTIPSAWIAEAGMQGFKAVTSGYRCEELHTLMVLLPEVGVRNSHQALP
jgi:hypothetical protein